MANIRISLNISNELIEECRRRANAQRKSINQFIIDAIEQYTSVTLDIGERTILCTVIDEKNGQD